MRPEILYRRCNSSEAEKSTAARGLVIEPHMLKIRHVIAKCEQSKWVSHSRKKVLSYLPKGVDPEDYRHCIVLKMVPGTLDALALERQEGNVKEGRPTTYGIPSELLEWFNGHVLEVEKYDLKHEQLPLYVGESTLDLLRADDGNFACFVSFSPKILDSSQELHFNDKFNMGRKSWLKTSLLWALWRGDWMKKEGQECMIEINLPGREIDFLIENAVSTKIPGKHEILCQYDPDRKIVGRRWIAGKDFFVKAGRTAHFAIPSSVLRNYATEYGMKDITGKIRNVFLSKPPHPTQALYEELKLSPEEHTAR